MEAVSLLSKLLKDLRASLNSIFLLSSCKLIKLTLSSHNSTKP